MTETAGPEATAMTPEDIKTEALAVLTDIFAKRIAEHPNAVPDLQQVLAAGQGDSAEAITESVGQRRDDISQIIAEAQQAQEQAAAEAGLDPQSQAAAVEAELTIGALAEVVQRSFAANLQRPLEEIAAQLAKELDNDPDEDPEELADLTEEDYELIFDQLVGEELRETGS